MNKEDGLRDNYQTGQTSRTELSDEMLPDTQLPTSPMERSKQQATLLMWLIIASPAEHRGTVLPIADGTIIGRHGDIPWHDMRMSRKHAMFIRMDDPENPEKKVFALEPQKDRNGTLVNGERITTSTPLRENDVIIMGSTRFIVKVLE